MKHRALGIIFIAVTLAASAQPVQTGQAAEDQTQEGVAPNQQQIPVAQQESPGPSQPQLGAFERRPTAVPNWNHNHPVYPNTNQLPDNGDPTFDKQRCDNATHSTSVETVTRAINPNDTNYGGILSQWHRELVHALLMSIEFWGLMCALVVILGLLLYINWLLRQRDHRLRVTVDIVLQLTNSRNFARFHNLRVIKIHNDLVERLNAQYERELRDGGDGTRDVESSTLPALGFLAYPNQALEPTVDHRQDPPDSDQGQEVSTVPSVAAASQFGIESMTQFKPLGVNKKPMTSEKEVPTSAQSDVDIALARANAAAAGKQVESAEGVKEEESLEVKNRRLEAQVKALEQYKVSARNQINQLRQANAAGSTDGLGDPK